MKRNIIEVCFEEFETACQHTIDIIIIVLSITLWKALLTARLGCRL